MAIFWPLLLACLASLFATGCNPKYVRPDPAPTMSLEDTLTHVNLAVTNAREKVTPDKNTGTLIESITLQLALTKLDSSTTGSSASIGVEFATVTAGLGSTRSVISSTQSVNTITIVMKNPVFGQYPGSAIEAVCQSLESMGLKLSCIPAAR